MRCFSGEDRTLNDELVSSGPGTSHGLIAAVHAIGWGRGMAGEGTGIVIVAGGSSRPAGASNRSTRALVRDLHDVLISSSK